MDTHTQFCKQLIIRYCFQNQEHEVFGQYREACSSSHFTEFGQTAELCERWHCEFCLALTLCILYMYGIYCSNTNGIKNLATRVCVLGLYA